MRRHVTEALSFDLMGKVKQRKEKIEMLVSYFLQVAGPKGQTIDIESIKT